MHESFGARLRQHREKRDVSLQTIAERTKIKLSLLEGLERDDISRWPAGIFRRAYLRDYAQAIGLDPDVVVRDFLEHYPEPVEPVEPPSRPRGIVGTFGSFALRRRANPIGDAKQTSASTVQPPPRAIAPPPSRFVEPSPPVALIPSPSPAVPEPPEQPAAESTKPPPPAVEMPPERAVDFLSVAKLCTELGRVDNTTQMQPLLRDAATIVEAKGLIVWIWDAIAAELRPALAHGYPNKVLAQLPGLGREADNVTAAAFRTGETLAFAGGGSSALAVPLLTPSSCAGVLAIELPRGREESPAVRAVATFVAAMLAQLVGGAGSDATPAPEPVEQPV